MKELFSLSNIDILIRKWVWGAFYKSGGKRATVQCNIFSVKTVVHIVFWSTKVTVIQKIGTYTSVVVTDGLEKKSPVNSKLIIILGYFNSMMVFWCEFPLYHLLKVTTLTHSS